MDLDRGLLARIDRKVLSGLGHDESYRMVRVPTSEAVWSTWKRYCDAVGISMGRAIMALVDGELRSVVGESEDLPLFLETMKSALTERRRALDVRERKLEVRERGFREIERCILLAPLPPQTPGGEKVGRNEPCPCGSGLKYKRCHGAWPISQQ